MFKLRRELFEDCQRLGTYKFFSIKECSFKSLKLRVEIMNSRHPEGWKFACIKKPDGHYVVLVDKGEFTLEGRLILNTHINIFEGEYIKKWPRSRNRPRSGKTRAKME